jgi:hypothetical protein
MTFQNISNHFVAPRNPTGPISDKSTLKAGNEGGQSLPSGRDLLKNRPLPKVPDLPGKHSESEISEHQRLKEKVKSKEKLTLREQIKLLSKKLDVKALTTDKDKETTEKEKLKNAKSEANENDINNANGNSFCLQKAPLEKDLDRFHEETNVDSSAPQVNIQYVRKEEFSDSTNEVNNVNEEFPEEKLRSSISSTPQKSQQATPSIVTSPTSLLAKLLPSSFFSPTPKHLTTEENSKAPPSLLSPSFDKEEMIQVQQVEEFMSSMIDIIRSLFTFTEDLELKIEYYIILATSFLPSKLQSFLHLLSPVLKQFALLLELFFVMILIMLELIIELCSYVWNQSKNESPELVLGMVFGFLFCFFGSFFITTIAAFEAFRLFGYDRLLQSIKQINDDLKKLKHSSQRFSAALIRSRSISLQSEAVQENLDTSTNDQALTYKPSSAVQPSNLSYPSLPPSFLLQSTFTTLAAINPNHLFQAIFVLNAGFFAALTTLKIQFAKTITLGNSIGTLLEKPVFYVCQPLINSFFPDDLREWGHFFLKMALKFVSISISWTLQRFLSLFHSAIRGGLLISKNLFEYLIKYQIMKRYLPVKFHFFHGFVQSHKTGTIFGFGYLLAIFGMYFQFVYRNALPFPFNYLFSPVLLFERTLVWMVNNSSFIFQNM